MENRVIVNWNVKFFFFGTQVPCEVLEFMELEFLEKNTSGTRVLHMELEFQKKKKKKNPKCTFAITWCSKNRVTFETRFLENRVSK